MEYSDEQFRKDVEESLQPLVKKLTDNILETKHILETKFPDDMPMEQRSDIMGQVIKHQAESLVKMVDAIDLEKVKDELDKKFGKKETNNEQQS